MESEKPVTHPRQPGTWGTVRTEAKNLGVICAQRIGVGRADHDGTGLTAGGGKEWRERRGLWAQPPQAARRVGEAGPPPLYDPQLTALLCFRTLTSIPMMSWMPTSRT